jgi:hypothetical protein
VAALGLICLAETLTHTGARNGYLESSRPQYSYLSGRSLLPAEGYVSWFGHVPVLQDAESSAKLAAFFLGQQGPRYTGFLDRRAAYSYLAALLLPPTRWEGGAYAAFVAVNLAFWWAAAVAMYWLVRRRTGDTPVAIVASFLVATGNGLIFMVGVPQSYVPAYATLILLMALAEWLRVWHPPHRLGPWLLLGWGAGVASTFYFSHIASVVFWWVYGARRVPWRYLAAATALAFGIGALWELWGRSLAGLDFLTDNSSLVGSAAGGWLRQLRSSWPAIVEFARSATVAGTVLGAFPLIWWALAGLGLLVGSPDDREWGVAGVMAGLVPALAVLGILALPRIAYFMLPGVTFLAALGVVWLGRATGRWLARTPLPRPAARASGLALAAAAMALLALIGNADLLGDQSWNAQFHFPVELGR